MSQRKILFLIIVSIIFISIIGISIYVSGQKKINNTVPTSLKIWITNGTTDSYSSIIEGFKKYAPEYKKTDIIIEKQSSDPDRYRTLLLSTLTEGNGPDIFMLHSGEDAIIETKSEPIPSEVLDFSEFDKRYDDIFKDLLSSETSGKITKKTLKGVPLGYETLGVFYNKSLIREVPKTWNSLEKLYTDFPYQIYPSNLGLGPTYTPNMIDILPIWLDEADIHNYTSVHDGKNPFISYLNYSKLTIGTPENNEDTYKESVLSDMKTEMLQQKITTLDLFMQGNIAIIIGYPSLILELEKSSKRAGSSSNSSVILTDRLPQFGSQGTKNIGRYSYFGVSKLSKNGIASVKFLEYLMTPEAQRLFMNEYPYLIPAQVEFYETAKGNSLSETIDRTKLTPFIPILGEKLSIFDYGLKSRFEQYLRDGIDITENIDIESIVTKISGEISCEINSSFEGGKSEDCKTE